MYTISKSGVIALHPDLWRDELMHALRASRIYGRLETCAEKDPAVRSLVSVVDEVCFLAFQRTKLVVRHMKEYTLHDHEHLNRVLALMERLISDRTRESLQPLELALLVLSAYLHDVGMAPREEDVRAWKGLCDDPTDAQRQMRDDYLIYCKSRPLLEARVQKCAANGAYSQASALEEYRLAEWIRRSHAQRAESIILGELSDRLVYRDFNFALILSRICFSHNEDTQFLLTDPEMQPSVLVAPGEFANTVFSAVLLRLADVLDFDAKRTPAVLFEHIGVRDPISLKEWEKHRAINAWLISPSTLMFSAVCKHPAIEKSIRDFCSTIDGELLKCHHVLQNLSYTLRRDSSGAYETYQLALPMGVDQSQIRAGHDRHGQPLYQYVDLQFSLDQQQIVHLLMGTNLYGNSSVAMRELLQNATDTCRLREAYSKAWDETYTPSVEVTLRPGLNGAPDVLEVTDNGMGMDRDILINYFAKVGTSYYKSSEFHSEMARLGADFQPVSRFGIGILSCFMVADTVDIETKRLIGPFDTADALSVTITGLSGVFAISRSKRKTPGTTVRLTLRRGHPFGSAVAKKPLATVENLLRATVRNVPVPIHLATPTASVRVNPKRDGREHDQDRFTRWDVDGLPMYVKLVRLNLNGRRPGLTGTVTLGTLYNENAGGYESRIELYSRNVTVEQRDYNLTRYLDYSENAIHEYGDDLNVTASEVSLGSSQSTVIQSHGHLSVNGFTVPDALFSSDRIDQIRWPLPVEYDLDLSGPLELNLTASRDRIVLDDRWYQFKRELADIVAECLVASVGDEDKAGDLLRSLSEVDDKDGFIGSITRAIEKES